MQSEYDYYSILGVSKNASAGEIRRAFLALAKANHPDSRQAEGAKASAFDFSLLTEAYETLKDPERRAAYDQELNETRQLWAPGEEGRRRPQAFVAGLSVGIAIAIFAVVGVIYFDRSRGHVADKTQDSLSDSRQEAAGAEDGVTVANKDSASGAGGEAAVDHSESSPASAVKPPPASSFPQPVPGEPVPEAKPADVAQSQGGQAGDVSGPPKQSGASSPVAGDSAQSEETPGQPSQASTPSATGFIEVAVGSAGHQTSLVLEPGRGETESFTDCPNCPQMVVIPSGQTIMGSRLNSGGNRSEEAPPHRIHIRKPLAISKHVISAGNWRACVDAGVCRLTLSSLLAVGPRVAATRISWFDAKTYVEWLSQTTGRRYRLLSEAEWEYAARANPSDLTAGHDYPLDPLKSVGGDYPRMRLDRAGSEGQNPWGIQGGNVLEWVEDCWHGNYEQAPSDASPWLSASGGDCAYRVVRGAGKAGGGFGWLISARAREFADSSAPTLGFRVAREITAPAKTALDEH